MRNKPLSTTILYFKNLVQHCDKPRYVVRELVADCLFGYKYVKAIMRRNILDRMYNAGLATPEIQLTAKRVFSIRRAHRAPGMEKQILKNRVKEANTDIYKIKNQWSAASRKAEGFLSGDSIQEYRNLKNWEIQRIWNIEKESMLNKLKRMRMREMPREVHGIPNRDEDLLMKFGIDKEEGLVLAGIEVTQEIRDFLKLPCKFRTFPTMDKTEMEIQAEFNAAKQRISAKAEPEGLAHDERLKMRELEHQIRQPRQGGLVSWENIRATEMPSHKRIYQPEQLAERQEIVVELQKQITLEIFDKYVQQECDEKVPKGAMNLTASEYEGKQQVLKGIKTKGWMISTTDKSGRLVLDSKDNYLKAMEKHSSKDIQVGYNEVKESEKILNSHARALCKAFMFGKEAGEGQHERILEAIKVQDSGVPVMVGSRKDHKVGFDRVTGPPTRPVVNGRKGPNSNLANVLTRM